MIPQEDHSGEKSCYWTFTASGIPIDLFEGLTPPHWPQFNILTKCSCARVVPTTICFEFATPISKLTLEQHLADLRATYEGMYVTDVVSNRFSELEFVHGKHEDFEKFMPGIGPLKRGYHEDKTCHSDDLHKFNLEMTRKRFTEVNTRLDHLEKKLDEMLKVLLDCGFGGGK